MYYYKNYENCERSVLIMLAEVASNLPLVVHHESTQPNKPSSFHHIKSPALFSSARDLETSFLTSFTRQMGQTRIFTLNRLSNTHRYIKSWSWIQNWFRPFCKLPWSTRVNRLNKLNRVVVLELAWLKSPSFLTRSIPIRSNREPCLHALAIVPVDGFKWRLKSRPAVNHIMAPACNDSTCQLVLDSFAVFVFFDLLAIRVCEFDAE